MALRFLIDKIELIEVALITLRTGHKSKECSSNRDLKFRPQRAASFNQKGAFGLVNDQDAQVDSTVIKLAMPISS